MFSDDIRARKLALSLFADEVVGVVHWWHMLSFGAVLCKSRRNSRSSLNGGNRRVV